MGKTPHAFLRTTPTKRCRTESNRSSKKHCKFRKMEGRHFIPTKTVIPTFSLSPALEAITPQATTTAICIFMQPQAAQAQPKPEQSETATNLPTFCHLCTLVCRKYPNNYTSLNHSEWLDPEEVQDWNGKRERRINIRKKQSKGKEKCCVM